MPKSAKKTPGTDPRQEDRHPAGQLDLAFGIFGSRNFSEQAIAEIDGERADHHQEDTLRRTRERHHQQRCKL